MNPAIDEAFREMREDGEKARIESELYAAKKRIAKLERLVEEVAVHALCPDCGPQSKVDEDGLCMACGGTTMGWWVDNFRKRARRALGKVK